MPWDKTNYPASMKNLDTEVREKAVEIANALVEEGYEEGRAIPIAISQARRWAENQPTRTLHVVPHPEGWAVREEGRSRASIVLETKEEAQNRALEIGKYEGADVVIHDENGRIESYVDVIQEVE